MILYNFIYILIILQSQQLSINTVQINLHIINQCLIYNFIIYNMTFSIIIQSLNIKYIISNYLFYYLKHLLLN
jgi:hypothetical protein